MTEYELAQALFRQQQAPDASTPTTSQVRGVAASDSADGVVTVVLDATAGGASAEMEVPTTGGITEGSEVLVTLLDGAPVEVTQAGSIDGAAGSATKYITETGDYGIRVHPEGDTANYSLIDADGMDVVKGGTNVAHFGETTRVGNEAGGHVTVTDGGMGVYDGDTMLSEFAGDHASILPNWAESGRTVGDIGYISIVGDSGRIETEIGPTRDIMRIRAFGPLYLQAYDGVYAQSDNGGLQTSVDLASLVSTAWADLPLASGVTEYDYDSAPKYKKVLGSMVAVSGAVKPTSQVAAGGSVDIGTLPEGFRPSRYVCFPCQGSGGSVWLLGITDSGVLSCSRYRNGSTNAAIGTSAWLTFHCTFAL